MNNSVLIVEDSSDVRAGLQIALEGQGYRVSAAPDGREGIRLFRELRPDLVLLDIRMPRLSGIDVCTLIRNEADTPVIMFSGVDDRAGVLLALQRGASDYVLKDTGYRELLNRVGKHLRRYSASPLAARPAAAGKAKLLPFSPAGHPATEGRPAADLTGLRVKRMKVEPDSAAAGTRGELLENLIIVAHSEPDALEQLSQAAGRTSYEVAAVATGQEALEVLAARRPKLLLLGNVLTDMNCMAVVEAVSQHPLGELIGMVLAIGRRSPELARRARYLGVHETVFMPWNDGRLDVAIRGALAATRKARTRIAAA